jgi:outer membrane protein TolC
MNERPRIRAVVVWNFAGLATLLCLVLASASWSQTGPDLGPTPAPTTFSLHSAVMWALEHNPSLATFRKNKGIAAAAVQIARQYPFNPIFQHFVWYGNGPSSAGITNHVFNEHTGRLDLELNRQGSYRRGMATAALTRTEWEIAAQELLVSIQVARAFNTLIYREGKYRIMEESTRFTEQTASLIKDLAEGGGLTSADRLLAGADVIEAENLMGPGRSVLVVAHNDLRRALGLTGEQIEVDGTLEKGFAMPPLNVLLQAAVERRPDLHALEFAVREADNRRRLEIANRWGNPSLGPAFEYNETSVYFTGTWLIWSPPVLNTRRGEIRQREAEQARAVQAMRQGEILVHQDVYAALARLDQAEKVVISFRDKMLPKLRQTVADLDKLYLAKSPGVDMARVLDIRRRELRARDAYLDALFELSQAQVDLAAAVADVSFAGCVATPMDSVGDRSNTATEDQKKPEMLPGELLPNPNPLPKQPQPPNGEKLPPPKQVPDK